MKQKIFKIIVGALIVAVIEHISTFLVALFKLQFPPAIVGMVILTLLLYFKVLPIHLIEDICKLLLNNMVLFFIPVTLGVVLYADIIRNNFVTLVVIIIVSTIVTLLATAFTVEYFVERKHRKQREYGNG